MTDLKSHVFAKTCSPNKPDCRCGICEGTLGLCAICGQAEAELEDNCPGMKLKYPKGRYPDKTIVQIALDVHMTNTGSMERGAADQRADIEYLRERLKQWQPMWDLKKTAKFLRFDEAVRHLLLTVLEE